MRTLHSSKPVGPRATKPRDGQPYRIDARSLEDAANRLADWLDGSAAELAAPPLHVPHGAECGPRDVLAAANRAGILTVAAQNGAEPTVDSGRLRLRRAAVVALVTDRAMRRRLRTEAHAAGLTVTQHPFPRFTWRLGRGGVDVSMLGTEPEDVFGARWDRSELRYLLPGCHPDLLREAARTWQVTIVDPVWGHNDRLWPLLARIAAPASTQAGPRTGVPQAMAHLPQTPAGPSWPLTGTGTEGRSAVCQGLRNDVGRLHDWLASGHWSDPTDVLDEMREQAPAGFLADLLTDMQTDLHAAGHHEQADRLNEAEQLLRRAAALIGETDHSQHGADCPGCNGDGITLTVRTWEDQGDGIWVPVAEEPDSCRRGQQEEPHGENCACGGSGYTYEPGYRHRCTTRRPADQDLDDEPW
ncbi:DUF6919 domain-containing protein [Kitasatospora sp. NPDC127060]|uniref:DUF6919 domain-containing protein n=1 Tax=Kitasatospora sp. NPDC127060 TaxID=3347121 RepID=UPI003660CA4B